MYQVNSNLSTQMAKMAFQDFLSHKISFWMLRDILLPSFMFEVEHEKGRLFRKDNIAIMCYDNGRVIMC